MAKKTRRVEFTFDTSDEQRYDVAVDYDVNGNFINGHRVVRNCKLDDAIDFYIQYVKSQGVAHCRILETIGTTKLS